MANFFTRLFGFGRGGEYPEGNPALVPAQPEYTSTRSLAGVTVTSDTALTVSSVFRGAKIIATTIAGFPIDILEKQPPKADGTPSPRLPREYEVDAALWRKPNREQVKVVFWGIVVGHMVLDANAFVMVVPDGATYHFWIVEPERVEVARFEDGRKGYRIDGDKVYFDFADGGDIIHFQGWGRDTLVGVSPVKKMMNALGLAKAAEEYAARFFGNGTVLGGVLSTTEKLKPEEAADYKARWDAAHTGVANAHQVAVLSQGLSWQSATTSPNDSQLIESREFQVAEGGRITGTPEHLIGSHDKSTSWGQGLEINNRAFMQFNLMDFVLRIEETINEHFLAVVNDDPRYPRVMKLNVSAMMRGTNAERAAFYWQMFQMGAYSTNDILALEDRPGIGPEGDIHYVPGNNLTPISQLLNPPADGGAKSLNDLLERQVRDVLASLAPLP